MKTATDHLAYVIKLQSEHKAKTARDMHKAAQYIINDLGRKLGGERPFSADDAALFVSNLTSAMTDYVRAMALADETVIRETTILLQDGLLVGKDA